MTNCFAKLMIRITTSTRPAAIMHSAFMMTPEERPWKVQKLLCRQDCFSISLTRKTMRKTWCTTTRNSMKAQKISSLLQPFITCVDTMKKQLKFTKNYCLKVASMKPSTSTLLYVTIRWNISMFPSKFCQAMKLLTLKASSLPISRLAITIKSILERTLKKP